MSKLIIGKILSSHGLKGAIEVELDIDFEDTKSIKTIYLQKKSTHEFVAFNITFKRLNDKTIAFIKGITTQEQAKKFANATIFVDKNVLKSKEDTLYLFELYGKDVYLDDNTILGKLTNIFRHGNTDYLEIDNGKHLIPAKEPFVIKLDKNTIILAKDFIPKD